MRILTHDGIFHADEVFAISVLRRVFGDVEIIRTRSQEEIQNFDGIVVDVGGEFSPERNRFDHHQRTGPTRMDGRKFSSAGLIWDRWGRESLEDTSIAKELNSFQLGRLWFLVDQRLFRGIDAIDNGEIEFPTEVVSLSGMISLFNSPWGVEQERRDDLFALAIDLAGAVLDRVILEALSKVRAEGIVSAAIDAKITPEVLVLEEGCPWQQALLDSGDLDTLFTVFPAPDSWRVQAVPTEVGSFQSRKLLPEDWAGKPQAELAALTGIDDIVFVHPGRFIGGASSKEGALAMASAAVSAA